MFLYDAIDLEETHSCNSPLCNELNCGAAVINPAIITPRVLQYSQK